MLVQINYTNTDKFGSWDSNSCGFANSDGDAKRWANSELQYLRNRFPDLTISNVMLYECLLDTADDRLICEIN